MVRFGSCSSHRLWLAISDLLTGYSTRQYLDLTMIPVLRRLTFRTTFGLINRLGYSYSFLTIVSPVFCELVLEIHGTSSLFDPLSLHNWHFWSLLLGGFARSRDLRLIIRASALSDLEELGREAERALPSLAMCECIYLETL